MHDVPVNSLRRASLFGAMLLFVLSGFGSAVPAEAGAATPRPSAGSAVKFAVTHSSARLARPVHTMRMHCCHCGACGASA